MKTTGSILGMTLLAAAIPCVALVSGQSPGTNGVPRSNASIGSNSGLISNFGKNTRAVPETPAPAANAAGTENKPEEKENTNPCWCNPGEKFDFSTHLFGKDSCIDIGGWTNPGYTTLSDGFWNDQPDRVNLSQLGLYIEKVVDSKEGFDWGFRVNGIYGIDGPNSQAFGNTFGTYDYKNISPNGREAWSLPELYGVLAYKDLSVKIGHFFTPHGYEVIPAPGNFFYSHAFTFNFSEPFTHTGALATYKVNDKLVTQFGYVLGNDTGFQSNLGGSAFIGGFTYNVTDKFTLGVVVDVGDFGFIGNGIFMTTLLTWKPTDDLEWVVQYDHTKHDNVDFTQFYSDAIVNYVFYKMNDCVRLGSRTEWYRVLGEDYYEATVGVNFTPQANVRIRPEFRYQWGGGSANPLNLPMNRGIFGIDMVLVF